jgi:hypothetical protein
MAGEDIPRLVNPATGKLVKATGAIGRQLLKAKPHMETFSRDGAYTVKAFGGAGAFRSSPARPRPPSPSSTWTAR